MVSGLEAGACVEDEGVVDALFGGSGLGSEGYGQFGLGVALVAGEVDPDGPAVCRSLVAQSQDRLRLPVAGEVGRDVAEPPAVGHDWSAAVGPALGDVGADPRGDGAAG